MADEATRNGNSLFGAGKPSGEGERSADSAAGANPTTAGADTSNLKTATSPDDLTADSDTIEKEKAALGEAGPGTTPAFGKHGGGDDENNPLTQDEQIDALNKGAEQQSAGQASASAQDLIGLEAAALAPDLPEDDDSVQYTSHPIANFRLGRFQFEQGLLTLKGEAVEKFEKLLGTAGPRDQNLIRKIDRRAGEKIARSFVQSRHKAGTDTSEDRPNQ